MWWWIVVGVVVALIAFACWIAWELIHAPILDDVLAGFTLDDDDDDDDDDDEEDESEDVGSNR